jgi:predicted flap endonuclease-1-like 5' DNA nuclease
MELVNQMDLIREYWWLIIVALALVLVLAFMLLRPRQSVKLTDGAPVRPHMQQTRPPEGRGLAGEAAAATSDVTGELLRAPVRNKLDGVGEPHDDLCRIKGVGPKFADALHRLGFIRFEQLAQLSPTEIDRIDDQLGAFRGRLSRDRITEQADYLARGDTDGFEQRFGKL